MIDLRGGAFSLAIFLLGVIPSQSWSQPLWPPLPPSVVVNENETPPNDTSGAANPLTLTAGSYLGVNGGIATAGDLDYFSFTLTARTGVFFMVRSRQPRFNLSATLDSMLTLYDSTGSTVIVSNDNGYDFDTGWPAPGAAAGAATGDSALYQDLNAGTYYIRVSSVGGTTGNYQLVILPDTNYTATVPVLASNPTASKTLHLKFDGHTSATDSWTVAVGGPYTIPPFDFQVPANPAEFTPGEQKAIRNIWRQVSEDFSPFDVNVTTSYAGPIADGVAHRHVIGNDDGTAVGAGGALGVAFLTSFAVGGPNNNTAFTFASNFYDLFGGTDADQTNGFSGIIVADAVEMGNTTSHEFGHALGLRHYGGGNPQTMGIMHTPDFGLNREIWRTGNTHDTDAAMPPFPPVILQDDMAVIAGVLGYRTSAGGVADPDDHGNSIATATAMTSVSPTIFYNTGIIHDPATDFDYFSFTVAVSGSVTIQVNVDPYANDLDSELYLYDSVGTLLGQDTPAASFSGTLTQVLTPGTYYIRVKSAGGPGEAGQYEVAVSVPPGGPIIPPVVPPVIPPGGPFNLGEGSFWGSTGPTIPEGSFGLGRSHSPTLLGPFAVHSSGAAIASKNPTSTDGIVAVINVAYLRKSDSEESNNLGLHLAGGGGLLGITIGVLVRRRYAAG